MPDTQDVAWLLGRQQSPPERLAYCSLLHDANRAAREAREEDPKWAARLCAATFDCAHCELFWDWVNRHRFTDRIQWLCAGCTSQTDTLSYYATGPEAPWRRESPHDLTCSACGRRCLFLVAGLRR